MSSYSDLREPGCAMTPGHHRKKAPKATVGEKKMTDDYIDPADLPDGDHRALVRWPNGKEAMRFVNRGGCLVATSSHVVEWELSSARIVTLLHRADECPGAGGWEPADLGPELAGQIVRVETPHGAVEGVAKWFEPEWVVRVFTRPDPHADLIEQLRDLLGSLPEPEMERVILAAKAAKAGGAS